MGRLLGLEYAFTERMISVKSCYTNRILEMNCQLVLQEISGISWRKWGNYEREYS